jgi:hypothetical protein
MIKAVLRYTDCLQDGKKVYTMLTNNKVLIVGTKRSWSMYPRIIIMLKNYDQLSSILHELNATCSYEVRLLKHTTVKERSK